MQVIGTDRKEWLRMDLNSGLYSDRNYGEYHRVPLHHATQLKKKNITDYGKKLTSM